jgi:signal transduction histidine kinase
MAGILTAIITASAYLHGVFANLLSEEYRYNNAVRQVATIAKRTATLQYLDRPNDLLQESQFLVNSRPDFVQIDVYQIKNGGVQLVTSTEPAAPRLPYLNESSVDNDLHEMEKQLPGIVTMEVNRNNRRNWIITVEVRDNERRGYVSALVQKASPTDFLSRLEFRQTLILGGASIVVVAMLYLFFAFFFQRPTREIAAAMARAQSGDLNARAVVHREDELGAIAKAFNSMIADIRARKEEREKLLLQVRNFNQQLQSEVADATRELRASNEALLETQQGLARSERLAALGQIAGSLAHEIGTPLNAISGHLRLLARNHPNDADTQRRVKIINAQLDSVVKAVRSLLARAQPPKLKFEPQDINELVEELLWLVQPTLELHKIEATTSLDRSVPRISVDRDSLLQLLLNLTNNSVDAMPNGGTIEVATTWSNESGHAELLFTDTGEGISAAAVNHLFEPLWTTKSAGSGFGLAIAREIAHGHGGKIELVRGYDRGASFRLALPLSTVKAAGEVLRSVA